MESINQETVQQLRKEIEDRDRRISEVQVLVDEITKLMEKKEQLIKKENELTGALKQCGFQRKHPNHGVSI